MRTLTPRQIAESYGRAWAATVDGTKIEDLIEDAIIEALDLVNDKYLGSALKQAERDRDGWMEAYIERGARHRAIVEGKDLAIIHAEHRIANLSHLVDLYSKEGAENVELRAQLAAISKARDEAVEAAHLVHEGVK